MRNFLQQGVLLVLPFAVSNGCLYTSSSPPLVLADLHNCATRTPRHLNFILINVLTSANEYREPGTIIAHYFPIIFALVICKLSEDLCSSLFWQFNGIRRFSSCFNKSNLLGLFPRNCATSNLSIYSQSLWHSVGKCLPACPNREAQDFSSSYPVIHISPGTKE